jgi:hypothetical protein
MTAVASVTAGQDILETWGDSVAAALNPYGCVLLRTTNQSISDATDAFVLFSSGNVTEELDTGSFHNPASNSERITIPAGGAGWYIVFATVAFNNDNDGNRAIYIEKNAATVTNGDYLARVNATAVQGGTISRLSTSTVVLLAAGDYVTLGVLHNAGASLNILAEDQAPRLGCVRLWGT